MTALSRRTFFVGVIASPLVAALRVSCAAAQPSKDEDSFESVLFGGKISITDDQWVFFPDLYMTKLEAEFQSEYLSIVTLNATTAEVEFVSGTMSPDGHVERYQEMYEKNVTDFKLEDSGETPDGPWFVGSYDIGGDSRISTYFEYQVNALDKADLIVILNGETRLYQEYLAAFQEGVEIDGRAPFKMLEASSAEKIGAD